MQDVIKIKSISYKRYEELLLKKEKLIQEGKKYEFEYDQLFGSITKEIASLRTECVKKRKIISYCKSVIGMGLPIIKKELDDFIEKSMKEYQETLAYILDEDKPEEVDKETSVKESKKIYHSLAKLIHPDMNNGLKDDVIIQDLWNRTCIAYNCSNLKDLQELQVLTNKYLDSISNEKLEDIEIPNIEEKIFDLYKEIDKITHSNPYQYKDVLLDKDGLEIKKEELNKELTDYKRYHSDLEEQVKEFDAVIKDE